MKAITLRKIPPDVARRILRRAEERGISLNRAVLELLRGEEEPRRGPRRRYDDLDALFGRWTSKEAAAFGRGLRSRRRVDPEVWT